MEIVDATELPSDERTALVERVIGDDGGVIETANLRQDAMLGELDGTPRTITTLQFGDSPEAALARAYKIRDVVESETNVSVECELTGRGYQFPDTVFYEIELRLNGG